jgi:polyisoprenoid-binding protein YceI
MKTKHIFLLALSILIHSAISAQMYTVSPNSQATVIGTSTLHDWESEVEDISGSGKLEFDGTVLKAIPNMEIKFLVESIESGKGKMNSITYETLKSESHPHIIYKVLSLKGVKGDMVTVSGNLTIAGETRKTDVTGRVVKENGNIRITGRQKIDMTQFNIEPPKAMFGTIVVGKDIDLDFNILLKQK